MRHKAKRMAGVFIAAWMFGLFISQPVMAGIMISDGSSGEFQPVTDTIIDLSGTDFPQFSRVLIGAGITLKVLLPEGGVFGRLLARDDILLNGIVDAGSGALGVESGRSIVMGSNARIIGGNIFLRAGDINLDGVIDAGWSGTISSGNIDSGAGGSITLRSPRTVRPVAGFNIPVNPGARIIVLFPANVPEPGTLLLMLPGLALIAFRKS